MDVLRVRSNGFKGICYGSDPVVISLQLTYFKALGMQHKNQQNMIHVYHVYVT